MKIRSTASVRLVTSGHLPYIVLTVLTPSVTLLLAGSIRPVTAATFTGATASSSAA